MGLMPLTSITYDADYFQGRSSQDPEPSGYSEYSATTYANETAEQLAQKFLEKSGQLGTNLIGRKVLVVGCAYGFLVQYLTALGLDCYGMDISSFAISQAPTEVASKLRVGDVRVEADWQAMKTLAGLTRPNDKFDLVIDEDMIVCLTDAEASAFRTLALKYGDMVIHFLEDNPTLATWYNYHTIAQWKTLLGTSPKEKWYTRFDWRES